MNKVYTRCKYNEYSINKPIEVGKLYLYGYSKDDVFITLRTNNENDFISFYSLRDGLEFARTYKDYNHVYVRHEMWIPNANSVDKAQRKEYIDRRPLFNLVDKPMITVYNYDEF